MSARMEARNRAASGEAARVCDYLSLARTRIPSLRLPLRARGWRRPDSAAWSCSHTQTTLRAAGNAVTTVLVFVCFRSSTSICSRRHVNSEIAPPVAASPTSTPSRVTSDVNSGETGSFDKSAPLVVRYHRPYLNLRAISARVNVASQETLRDVFSDPPCSSLHSLSAGPVRPTGSPHTPQSIPAPIRNITRARAVERPFLLGELCHGVCPMVQNTEDTIRSTVMHC
jgi:hypothetical protein